jgi:tRNA A-37 threonylcarbamoyl transferase component Bud32
MKQIRAIIQDLHNIGYAHHDIAMRNIMYNEETYLVKIIDFGLAHKLSNGYYKNNCIKEDLEMIDKVEKKLFYPN